jgi:hypothetical protein
VGATFLVHIAQHVTLDRRNGMRIFRFFDQDLRYFRALNPGYCLC